MGLECPYTEIIIPEMKEAIIASLIAVKDVLQHRDLSHELFGYDFMIDNSLNVWMLEVNSSPDMSFSTPITEKLVTEMMPNLGEILLDYNHGKDGNVGDVIGNYELIYDQNEASLPQKRELPVVTYMEEVKE